MARVEELDQAAGVGRALNALNLCRPDPSLPLFGDALGVSAQIYADDHAQMLPVRALRGYLRAVLIGALALRAILLAPAAAAESPDSEAEAGAEAAELAKERGNTVLNWDAKVPSFDVSAQARFVVMLGETRQLSQPIGYGFGLTMRVHPWRAGSAHLGFSFSGGHLRAPQLERLASVEDPNGPLSPRWQRVAMSDFAGGLSLRAPAGPIVVSTELGGGLVIGEFVRPTAAEVVEDEVYESVDPSIRAALTVGAPFRNNHGLVVGVGLTKVFSGLPVPDEFGREFSPFDLFAELTFGYQGWF